MTTTILSLIKEPITILLIALVGMGGFTCYQHKQIDQLEGENQEKQQNIEALSGTVEHYVTEYGREVQQRVAFAGETGQKLSGLRDTIEDLQRENTQTVISLQNVQAMLTLANQQMSSETTEEQGVLTIDNEYSDEYATIQTTTNLNLDTKQVIGATLNEVSIPMAINSGVIEREDGRLVTFVTIDNPYVDYNHTGYVFDHRIIEETGFKRRHLLMALVGGVGLGVLLN
jgi:hypothetical protein